MSFDTILSLAQSTLELGLVNSIVVLALFLSYSMLNVCDLSTDGCFTLGAVVGCVIAKTTMPYLAIPAAIAVGMLSGFITALLQTKMGINSLLAGIIVNTGLYSVNIAVMKGASVVNINKEATVYTLVKGWLEDTPLASSYKLLVNLFFVVVVGVLLVLFLKTRLGLAIRATGDNPEMVRSSSVNSAFTTIIGLTISGGMTALSGCLLAQSQKSAEINIGTGMVTMALASLLIGYAFLGRKKIPLRALGMVLGACIFRLVYTIALRFNMPAYMLKLVSSLIVILAISLPYLKSQWPTFVRRQKHAQALRRQNGGKK